MELRTSSSKLGRSTSNNSVIEVVYRDDSTRSETSPERTKVWTEPPSKHHSNKVPVVYYLTRNGQLEHPHFIEVPLSSSSSNGLYLRDVINRLNSLRGKSMATMYSWSSKRSYKNGYVWNDLGENDFIYPSHGNEYVLKGSELLEPSKSDESVNSTSKELETSKETDDSDDLPAITRRRNQSWSSVDLQEYKVIYKAESSGELSGGAADASTQTDDKRRRRRATNEIEEQTQPVLTTELTREEISPPPSESSPETLETLMKSDGKAIKNSGESRNDLTINNQQSGRMKASTVLMQLLTCGSISFKNCEDHPGLSLMSSQYKHRLPRGGGDEHKASVEKKNVIKKSKSVFGNSGRGKVQVTEEREYFSGSLVDETNKAQVHTLKRSSSYNADRRIE